MPQGRLVAPLKKAREVGPMVEEKPKTRPVTVEVVRECETITRHLNQELVSSERLRCGQRTWVEGINGDGGSELVGLCLR